MIFVSGLSFKFTMATSGNSLLDEFLKMSVVGIKNLQRRGQPSSGTHGSLAARTLIVHDQGVGDPTGFDIIPSRQTTHPPRQNPLKYICKTKSPRDKIPQDKIPQAKSSEDKIHHFCILPSFTRSDKHGKKIYIQIGYC